MNYTVEREDDKNVIQQVSGGFGDSFQNHNEKKNSDAEIPTELQTLYICMIKPYVGVRGLVE